jgi:hypothetical protein
VQGGAAASTQGEASSASSWLADNAESAAVARAAFACERDAASAALKTLAAREEFERNGVAPLRGVIKKEWIEILREGCETAQDEPGPSGQWLGKPTDAGTFFTDLEIARRLPAFAAFALHGPCAAIAGSATASTSMRYLYDQLFIKERGVNLPTPWHQDGGYWRVSGSALASVFVPLDRVSKEESLAFVAGSHGWRLHNPQHFADGTPYVGTSLPPMLDIDSMVDSGRLTLRQFDLEPGDALVFSSSVVHGGRGNWGRALSTRWAGDGTTFWARPGEGAVPTGYLRLRDGESLAHNSAAFPEAWRVT